MPVSKRLRASLQWGREERDELTDTFLEHKIFTYVETLADLAVAHGADVTPDDIVLSDEILVALKRESIEHAGMVVDTFNRDLGEFLQRNSDLERDRLLDAYEQWAEARADSKAETVAVTEAYSAAADATMAFYAANADQAEPLFDFGGHGDDDAQCAICQALVQTSPHPLARVVDVGSPHINCRQDWHETGELELPEELAMPSAPAGIVGKQHFLGRHGDDRTLATAALLTSAVD